MTTPPIDPQQCQQWVTELAEPSTRRAARLKLVAAGAVGPLLQCLQSANYSVRWAAVESLGELRAKDAVEPLVDLLERGDLVSDTCEALTLITGQDFGADARRWREWLHKSGGGGQRTWDVAQCVRRTAEYLGVEPTGSGDSYQFRLSLPDGRAQKIAVYFGRGDAGTGQLVVVYSECGPADPKYFEVVLRKNLTIPAGAFAIRDIRGKPCFVLVDTLLADAVTPGILAKHIENIASRADMVEKALAKEDRR